MVLWSFLDRLRDVLLTQERGVEPPLEIVPPEPLFDAAGWATDPRVLKIPSRRGWYYSKLSTPTGLPLGITAHFTATGAGTALGMARRRRDLERSSFPDPKPGSWSFTVAQDGMIIQQLSLRQGGFHAGSKTAKKLPIGWANHVTASIELEGHGKAFPEKQVESSCWLWRAIVQHCDIKREHAMFEHSWIDSGRKTDPGILFMTKHAPRVLDFSFEAQS
jgi:hypothetical protein